MSLLIQQVIGGIAIGSIYASLALAIVLIHRSTGVVNIAQGEMAMFSTYVAWQLTAWGWPIWGAILAAVGLSLLGGMLIERVAIRPVEGASHLTVLIVTIGLLLIFNQAAGWIWSFLVKDFPSPFPGGVWALGQVRLSASTIGVLVVLLASMGLLYLLFQYTKVGLAMRAVATNPESAKLVGIRVGRILMLGWGLAAALGALSGVMVAPQLFLTPNLMFSVLIYAIAAAALGGLDSPGGAVIGGLVVGVSENLAATYIDFIGSDLKVLVPFVIIIAVLMVKPTGLFGQREVARA
ncbi:MAG: branched-chain amino acid ABC transporter permease [Pseudonocardiaceae bacterium]|nr:branched-chain amino acid ABC transporter permease [Pseudonocardiaceae bacterium]